MRKWLNNYYNFSKSEFNGLLVLSGLMVALSLAPRIYGMVYRETDDPQEQLVIKKLIFGKEISAESNSFPESSGKVETHFSTKRTIKTNLFKFDPNSASLNEWVALGLSRKQAESIAKYTAKGGKFRRPEDLKKMYTLSSSMYNRILPYVTIKQDIERHPIYEAKLPSVKPTAKMVNVNTADSADLDEIKGIGPAFALRILKYRERLGGFYKKEQLLEVFGLDSTKYSEIKDQIKVDASVIRKININSAGIEDFKNHPYIRYRQANALIQYRTQHGNFGSITDLKKVLLLPTEVISKIEPYLTF